LGPLTNNGGPTLTHALLPNSPALDAGNPSPPGGGGGACEAADQRGQPRGTHGRCDIGAFEPTAPGDIQTDTETDTETDTQNNAGVIGNPLASNAGSAGTITRNPSAPQPPPPETSQHADNAKPASRGGRDGKDKSKPESSGLNGTTANSGWPSADSIDNERPWLTMKRITEANGDLEGKAAVVSAGVAFAAGAINLYLRSGTIFGLIFSFPLWGSVDPVHVLMVSSRERKRRNKEIRRERKIEDRVDRVGRYFEE
jgi:hypothetical protein